MSDDPILYELTTEFPRCEYEYPNGKRCGKASKFLHVWYPPFEVFEDMLYLCEKHRPDNMTAVKEGVTE